MQTRTDKLLYIYEKHKASKVGQSTHLEINKLMSVFHASVLLLIINFIITFVKVAVDPRDDIRVDSQTTLTM